MTNLEVQTNPTSTQVDEERELSRQDFSPDTDLELSDAELIEETDESDEALDEIEENEEEENWQKNYPYEVPRPALTIDEASSILGKSIRSIERSIQGKWGNRLPEGWHARKMKIDGVIEWRIIPPPGFRIRHTTSTSLNDTINDTKESIENPEISDTFEVDDKYQEAETSDPPEKQDDKGSLKLPGFGFSLSSFLNEAGQKAKTEIARIGVNETSPMEHPTIVIDRSDDVERLLRELADTQKELAEERRLHMEDMRLISNMQNSMRLLEDHASQTSIMKRELIEAQGALRAHKEQYEQYLKLPWWQKMFKKAP